MADHEFETRLAVGLRSIARDGLRPYDAAALSRASVERRRPLDWLGGRFGQGLDRRLSPAVSRFAALAGISMLVVAVVAVGAFGPHRGNEGNLGGGPAPSTSPSPSATPGTGPYASSPSIEPSALPSPATSGGAIPSGRVAFVLDNSLWVGDLDGQNFAHAYVPNTVSESSTITWSPTGSGLAILGGQTLGDGSWSLAFVGRDGKLQRNTEVPESLGQTDVSWAPDGTRVAVMGIGSNSRAWLRVVGVNPGDDRTITLPEGFGYEYEEHSMAWSPDGQWIGFTGCPGCVLKTTSGDLWVIRPDGTGLRQLTNGAFDYAPAWLGPSEIAFAREDHGDQVVMAIRPDGTGLRRVDRPREASFVPPSWNTGMWISPDQKWLAYAPRGTSTVHFIDLTGQLLDRDTVVSLGVPPAKSPTVRIVGWAPDDQLLVWTGAITEIDPSNGSQQLWPGAAVNLRASSDPVSLTFDH